MPTAKPKYWFKAKTYGYGWGLPCSWQGWVVMVIFVAAVIATAIVYNPADNAGAFALILIALSCGFVGVCWAKGEPLAWRWGNKPKDPSP